MLSPHLGPWSWNPAVASIGIRCSSWTSKVGARGVFVCEFEDFQPLHMFQPPYIRIYKGDMMGYGWVHHQWPNIWRMGSWDPNDLGVSTWRWRYLMGRMVIKPMMSPRSWWKCWPAIGWQACIHLWSCWAERLLGDMELINSDPLAAEGGAQLVLWHMLGPFQAELRRVCRWGFELPQWLSGSCNVWNMLWPSLLDHLNIFESLAMLVHNYPLVI